MTIPAPESAEDSFEELYESAPCGYLSMTVDGVVVKVNDTFLAWTGFSREEVVGTTMLHLLTVGSQLFYETRYMPVLRLQGEVREVALTLRRAEGGTLPALVNSTMVAGPHGPRLVRTAIFDSTGRQDYERELLAARRSAESSEERVRVLQGASTAFGDAHTEEALASALVETARSAFSATAAAVMLVGEAYSLQLVAGVHPLLGAIADGAPRPETDSISSDRGVTISGLDDARARYPAVAEALRTHRLEALSVTPLLDEGKPLGVLVCFFGRAREFDERALELQDALARQAAQVLSRVRLQRRLEQLALYDELTGLANRTLFTERLGQAIGSAHLSGRPLAIIFFDLDGFKAVNDERGHIAGDSVLRQVSHRLHEAVRADDVVGRFGGDEFVVICEDADEHAALTIAARIGDTVRRPLDDIPQSITASIGVAAYSGNGGTPPTVDDLLAEADAAMYRSKTTGRDRVSILRL
ncbi:diguanylate cyclase [Lacisediminihabitans sp.]|uniref:diguanylate cyclase n=1 Tax=Lacisediminihabitans sp. TaxID=2787631 RepID=UPI00374D4D12